MPHSRAAAMCCAETSASVQCVATRTERTPSSKARLQVVQRADAREEQRREHALRDGGCRGRLDPLPVRVAARAVGEARAGEAVAVRDLDRVDTGGVERACDLGDRAGR